MSTKTASRTRSATSSTAKIEHGNADEKGIEKKKSEGDLVQLISHEKLKGGNSPIVIEIPKQPTSPLSITSPKRSRRKEEISSPTKTSTKRISAVGFRSLFKKSASKGDNITHSSNSILEQKYGGTNLIKLQAYIKMWLLRKKYNKVKNSFTGGTFKELNKLFKHEEEYMRVLNVIKDIYIIPIKSDKITLLLQNFETIFFNFETIIEYQTGFYNELLQKLKKYPFYDVSGMFSEHIYKLSNLLETFPSDLRKSEKVLVDLLEKNRIKKYLTAKIKEHIYIGIYSLPKLLGYPARYISNYEKIFKDIFYTLQSPGLHKVKSAIYLNYKHSVISASIFSNFIQQAVEREDFEKVCDYLKHKLIGPLPKFITNGKISTNEIERMSSENYSAPIKASNSATSVQNTLAVSKSFVSSREAASTYRHKKTNSVDMNSPGEKLSIAPLPLEKLSVPPTDPPAGPLTSPTRLEKTLSDPGTARDDELTNESTSKKGIDLCSKIKFLSEGTIEIQHKRSRCFLFSQYLLITQDKSKKLKLLACLPLQETQVVFENCYTFGNYFSIISTPTTLSHLAMLSSEPPQPIKFSCFEKPPIAGFYFCEILQEQIIKFKQKLELEEKLRQRDDSTVSPVILKTLYYLDKSPNKKALFRAQVNVQSMEKLFLDAEKDLIEFSKCHRDDLGSLLLFFLTLTPDPLIDINKLLLTKKLKKENSNGKDHLTTQGKKTREKKNPMEEIFHEIVKNLSSSNRNFLEYLGYFLERMNQYIPVDELIVSFALLIIKPKKYVKNIKFYLRNYKTVIECFFLLISNRERIFRKSKKSKLPTSGLEFLEMDQFSICWQNFRAKKNSMIEFITSRTILHEYFEYLKNIENYQNNKEYIHVIRGILTSEFISSHLVSDFFILDDFFSFLHVENDVISLQFTEILVTLFEFHAQSLISYLTEYNTKANAFFIENNANGNFNKFCLEIVQMAATNKALNVLVLSWGKLIIDMLITSNLDNPNFASICQLLAQIIKSDSFILSYSANALFAYFDESKFTHLIRICLFDRSKTKSTKVQEITITEGKAEESTRDEGKEDAKKTKNTPSQTRILTKTASFEKTRKKNIERKEMDEGKPLEESKASENPEISEENGKEANSAPQLRNSPQLEKKVDKVVAFGEEQKIGIDEIPNAEALITALPLQELFIAILSLNCSTYAKEKGQDKSVPRRPYSSNSINSRRKSANFRPISEIIDMEIEELNCLESHNADAELDLSDMLKELEVTKPTTKTRLSVTAFSSIDQRPFYFDCKQSLAVSLMKHNELMSAHLLANTTGESDKFPPFLGEYRLGLIKLFQILVKIDHPDVHHYLISTPLLNIVMQLFFFHGRNNILHNVVQEIIIDVLKRDVQLLIVHLLAATCLVDNIVALLKKKKSSSQRVRDNNNCYMAHVKNIANALLKNKTATVWLKRSSNWTFLKSQIPK